MSYVLRSQKQLSEGDRSNSVKEQGAIVMKEQFQEQLCGGAKSISVKELGATM